jgi:protein tyrosine phosphatase (PTP) superfamily phosphohydrolase (DUF442 family)
MRSQSEFAPSSAYGSVIAPDKTRPKRRRKSLAVAGVVVAAIALFLCYIGVFGGNIHAVVANRVYRSAQLTGSNLDTVLQADHIRTVINLRGGFESDSWYRSELASCRQFGATHVDISMTDRHIPTPQALDELLNVFDHDPYPILFHCKAGADRSGLVGTLYLAVYGGVPVPEAENRELTWRYGHFSFGAAHPMNDFYNLYERTSGGESLRQWILDRYPALYGQAGQS